MNDSKLTIHPLGSGGWIPANGLETMCFAFFRNDEIFILDAGTGISRLLELRKTLFSDQWPKIKKAHIFLTHYHFDHIGGLFWVRAILNNIPITIYAPGEVSYGKPAIDLLNGLFRKPYSPYPFAELIPNVDVIDLDPPGVTINSGSEMIDVGVKLNPRHTDPTVALKFNDWFAFVTDTPPENETIDFVRGVKVLLHESYFDSSDRYNDENDDLDRHTGGPHTGNFGAGLIAKRAGIDHLYLIHHNPEIPITDVDAGAERVTSELGIECHVSRDLEEIKIELEND